MTETTQQTADLLKARIEKLIAENTSLKNLIVELDNKLENYIFGSSKNVASTILAKAAWLGLVKFDLKDIKLIETQFKTISDALKGIPADTDSNVFLSKMFSGGKDYLSALSSGLTWNTGSFFKEKLNEVKTNFEKYSIGKFSVKASDVTNTLATLNGKFSYATANDILIPIDPTKTQDLLKFADALKAFGDELNNNKDELNIFNEGVN